MASRWLLAGALVATVAGCATVPDSSQRTDSAIRADRSEKPSACAEFAEQRKIMRYGTNYRLAAAESASAAQNFKPLPAGEAARARHYTLRFDRDDVAACNHLVIRKELYLQRTPRSGLRFQETREFYSGDGTLVAVKHEALDNQLPATGYYLASVPLPIPQNAPTGNYRVVSKLLLQGSDGKAQLLATTSASFQVTTTKR
jgi:hypothetical protein